MSAIASPVLAQAEVPLTHGNVQTHRNRVEMLLQGGLVRPVRDQDRLGFGDAIRTNLASQADLQLNDGSFVRLGELTTFWVVPNTRNLWLAQGTGLMMLADSDPTQIETPNAIAQTQGATVVIRHVQLPDTTPQSGIRPGSAATLPGNTGRTAVMVLTDPERHGVQVSLRDDRRVELTAGQMAIVDGDILYLFEFDRDLFYQTSYLAQGLFTPAATTGEAATAGTETTASSATAEPPSEFTGDYWLDPRFLSPHDAAPAESGWLFPANTSPTATDSLPPAAPTDSTAPAAPSAPEPAMTDPGTMGGTTHNDLNIERELTPTPPALPSIEETLPPPNDSNTEGLDIPAGVIAPPAEPSVPEPPVPEPSSAPNDVAPPSAEPPPVEGAP
ncbi:FecR domain-containing protein [Halomicronema sp. CCY15110]|uniref:FecR domain-containing protein n=1 Tax=Halomicronema sp. CCY15110 TaxID=2767773 RepID=UPI001950E4C7|nr:FecR domain-containing protein [Halomicronema sp. CCY15110]